MEAGRTEASSSTSQPRRKAVPYWQQGKEPSDARAAADASSASRDDILTVFEEELVEASGGRYQPLEMRKRRRRRGPSPRTALAREGKAVREPPDKANKLLKDTPGVIWNEDGSPEPCGRVSVVCPTLDSRQDFHWMLYACFDAQDWPDKELVIIETQRSRPSPFFVQKAAEDDRVLFMSWKIVGSDKDMSIGLKRNIGLHLASGEWVATFDDDDLYAPIYLREMLGEMIRQQAVAITLGSWFVFEDCSGRVGYVDPRGLDGFKEMSRFTWGGKVTRVIPKDRDEWVYGYGFSYVYSRQKAMKLPYPDKDMGEDFDFFIRLRDRRWTAVLFDDYGLCLHTLHKRSTSSCEATEMNRDELGDLDVVALGSVFQAYLDGDSTRSRGSSRCFTGAVCKRPPRAVMVQSSQGDIEVSRPRGCTVLDIKKLVAPQFGVQSVDVGLFLPGKVEGHEPMADTAPVPLRMGQLWAVLPIDLTGPEEVPVLCVDAMDDAVSVEVRVMSSIKLGEMRPALTAQHFASSPKGQLRRLRLVNKVGNAFVGVDEQLPLGDVRQVHVMCLADVLQATKG